MDYCPACGNWLDGAFACPACGVPLPVCGYGPASAEPAHQTGHAQQPVAGQWHGPEPGLEQPSGPGYSPDLGGVDPADVPPTDAQSSMPETAEIPEPAEATQIIDAAETPEAAGPAQAAEPQLPLAPGPRAARRARGTVDRRAGRKAKRVKLLLGVLSGFVLAGVLVTVLPGEFVPGLGGGTDTPASAPPDGGDSASARPSDIPVADPGATGIPTVISRSARPSADAHPSASGSSSASANPTGGAAVPTGASATPTGQGGSSPTPQPTTTTTQPAPKPSKSHVSCVLFWCSG